MMNNNGDYNYWGMHMGWWILIVVLAVAFLGFFMNSRKRK